MSEISQATIDEVHEVFEVVREQGDPPHSIIREVMLQRRWCCGVVDSGHHNGARCRPDDPHDSWWRCGYYYAANIRIPA